MAQGIVLLSDFGDRDGAVAAMKGVIRTIAPDVAFLDDLSHQVLSLDIEEGSLLLGVNYQYYPKGTVFCCVVDPGVGTSREPILLETAEGYRFIAPNNGLLSEVIYREREAGREIASIVELTEDKYFRHPVSEVFHGRDIFAAVSAHAAQEQKVLVFGPVLQEEKLIHTPFEAAQEGGTLIGEVLFIDDFGNCVTNIRETDHEDIRKGEVKVNDTPAFYARTFAEGSKGDLLFLFGGDFPPFMTLALNKGSAAESFNITKGDAVRVSLP